MSRTFDELMKVLEEKGEIPDEQARAIIAEHGPLSDDEKKQIAAAIRMKKALTGQGTAQPSAAETSKLGEEAAEVSIDDYLQALSVLDSSDSSEEEKQQARRIVERFESQ